MATPGIDPLDGPESVTETSLKAPLQRIIANLTILNSDGCKTSIESSNSTPPANEPNIFVMNKLKSIRRPIWSQFRRFLLPQSFSSLRSAANRLLSLIRDIAVEVCVSVQIFQNERSAVLPASLGRFGHRKVMLFSARGRSNESEGGIIGNAQPRSV
jgi:hypothetical protein